MKGTGLYGELSNKVVGQLLRRHARLRRANQTLWTRCTCNTFRDRPQIQKQLCSVRCRTTGTKLISAGQRSRQRPTPQRASALLTMAARLRKLQAPLLASIPGAKQMHPLKPWSLQRASMAASLFAALALSACSKTPADAPLPSVRSAANAPSPPQSPPASPHTGPTTDVSVPPANAVLAPALATPVDPTAGRSNKAMSRAQESSAMPMPGQNNDHSAPLPPAKRASSP